MVSEVRDLSRQPDDGVPDPYGSIVVSTENCYQLLFVLVDPRLVSVDESRHHTGVYHYTRRSAVSSQDGECMDYIGGVCFSYCGMMLSNLGVFTYLY